jgi:hypothetical protein
MATSKELLDQAAALARPAAQIIHDIANGDDQADIQTANGPVPSMAKQSRTNRELVMEILSGAFTSAAEFGVKGDGSSDDLAAIALAVASGKPIWWPSGTYGLTNTLTVSQAQTWITAGKVKFVSMMPAGSPVRPLFDFIAKITSYGDFSVDHRANTIGYAPPDVYQGNPIAGSAILVQGDWSSVEDWHIFNAWDNGISAVRLNQTTGKEVAGSPKFGSFRNLKTVLCGVGEHINPETPGKIGAGVDVASASAWTVDDCIDYMSYTGFILDIGAGAQCQFSNCVAFFTKVDSNNPLNGSGHGFYSGSSESSFVNCISIESEYRAWRIDEVGTDFVNCHAYYPKQEGVFIKAGQFRGSFRIKGAGAKQANTYDAVLIDSSARAITELELDLHTTGSNHRWGVNAVGNKTIDAHVHGSVTGTTGLVNRQNYNIGTFLQNAAIGAGKRFAINRDVPGMEWDVYGRMRASADRANKNYALEIFGNDTDNGTFFVEDYATPAKRMAMGYDPANDAFVVQAIHAGVAKKPLLLNPSGGSVMIGTGTWQEPARLGNYRIWVDGSGRLRIKSGAPTSDGDGSIVGTQA